MTFVRPRVLRLQPHAPSECNKDVSSSSAGRPSDPHFDHKTGKGRVAGHKGDYDDAIRVKKNIACLLLHETLGGFSPPAACKIRRLGRAGRHGVDRTKYHAIGRRKRLPFVVHHTQRICKNIVQGDATATIDKIRGAKARLSNALGRHVPAAGRA